MLEKLNRISGLLTSLDVALLEADRVSVLQKPAKFKKAAEVTREVLAELTCAVGHLAEDIAAIRREGK